VPVAVCGLYVALSLGGWVALRIVQHPLGRAPNWVATLESRVRALSVSLGECAGAWPEEIRPGRYEKPDTLARESLASMQAAVDGFQPLWLTLAFYVPCRLSVVDVFSFRAWGGLADALAVRRAFSAVDQLLGRGEDALATLRGQERIVRDIPNAMRREAKAIRAQLRDLSDLLRAEERAGTLGLRVIALQLQRIEARIAGALAALDRADPSQAATAISGIDQVLDACLSEVENADRTLGVATALRSEAHELLNRMGDDIQMVEERWDRLRAAGAKEPAVVQGLPALQIRVRQLTDSYQERTLPAYRWVKREAPAIEAEIRSLEGVLSTLEVAMRRSQHAIDGLGQALVESQQACEDLQHDV